MSRQLLVACFFAGFSLGVFSCDKAHAQPYVGAGVARNWQHGLGDTSRSTANCQSSNTTVLLGGYRFKYAGAELGTGRLFYSHYDLNNGLGTGGQQLWASQQYARINGYAPVGPLEIVPFIGRARVRHTNHEEFILNDGEHLVNHTTQKTYSNFYGIGVQKTIEHAFVRLEYQHTYHVAEDFYTARGFSNSLDTVRLVVGGVF